MRRIVWISMVTWMMMLASCSDDDYLNAIPEGSTALMSIEVQRLSDIDLAGCGIDTQAKAYLFVSPEQTMGIVAKIDSKSKLERFLNEKFKNGDCQELVKHRETEFTVWGDTWVLGFNKRALVMVGPTVAAQQADAIRQISKYLRQKEEQGMKGTPIFAKLDSVGSPMALVAQAAALPAQVRLPFMLGTPKDADASQVLIAASMDVADGCLNIQGEPFSFNRKIDAAIKENMNMFRPIGKRFLSSTTDTSLLSIFMNVNGAALLPMLRQDESMRMMLLGINTAIDMDNIIKSIDGDMLVSVKSLNGGKMDFAMGAELSATDFWNDIDYWRASCPAGSRIEPWPGSGMKASVEGRPAAYHYTDGHTDFYFSIGVPNNGTAPSSKSAFVCGTDEATVRQFLGMAEGRAGELTGPLANQAEGSRLFFKCNLNQLDAGTLSLMQQFLTPLFGQIETIVYTM